MPNTRTAQTHTPGPWVREGTYVYSPGKHGGTICQVSEPRAFTLVSHKAPELGSPDLQEAFANARLIAAAPDLLEAIKAILYPAECWIKFIRTHVGPGQGDGMDEKFAEARAAIARAEGKA